MLHHVVEKLMSEYIDYTTEKLQGGNINQNLSFVRATQHRVCSAPGPSWWCGTHGWTRGHFRDRERLLCMDSAVLQPKQTLTATLQC